MGDLYIINLPIAISRTTLFNNLLNVQYIRGSLYFLNNVFLTALTFFSNLKGVYGVYLENNPLLVDARFPALAMPFLYPNYVDGCNRLCPQRYPAFGPAVDDTGCPTRQMEYYYWVQGDATPSTLATLAAVHANMITSFIGSNDVCSHHFVIQHVLILFLQWSGQIQIDVIEQGVRWINVLMVALDVGPTDYLLSVCKTAVNGGKLPGYANTSAETAFFKTNTVSTLATPLWIPDSAGYNTGNTLIGLQSLDYIDHLELTYCCSCDSSDWWSAVAMEPSV